MWTSSYKAQLFFFNQFSSYDPLIGTRSTHDSLRSFLNLIIIHQTCSYHQRINTSRHRKRSFITDQLSFPSTSAWPRYSWWKVVRDVCSSSETNRCFSPLLSVTFNSVRFLMWSIISSSLYIFRLFPGLPENRRLMTKDTVSVPGQEVNTCPQRLKKCM